MGGYTKEVDEGQWIDTLGIPDEVYHRFVRQIETESRAGQDRRGAQRLAILCDAMLRIRIIAPNGSTGRFQVRTFDISTSGIGLLHGQYLYQGTLCSLEVQDQSGNVVEIPAKVMRCEHSEKMVHVVGLQFDEPVDPSEYVWG